MATVLKPAVWQVHTLSDLPPGKRRRDTLPEHKHPPAEWERRRNRIVELFEDNDLPEVAALMAKEGFEASIPQYRHHLKQWNHWKYLRLTKKQWMVIGQKLLEREGEGKETTAFRLNGKNIPSTKLEKGLKEKLEEGVFDISSLRNSLSSGGISAYTASKGDEVTTNILQVSRVQSRIDLRGNLPELLERTGFQIEDGDRAKAYTNDNGPPSFLLRRLFDISSKENSPSGGSRNISKQSSSNQEYATTENPDLTRAESLLDLMARTDCPSESAKARFKPAERGDPPAVSALKARNLAMESALQAANMRAASATAERNRLRVRLTDLSRKLRDVEAKLASTESELDACRKSNETLTTDNENWKQWCHALDTRHLEDNQTFTKLVKLNRLLKDRLLRKYPAAAAEFDANSHGDTMQPIENVIPKPGNSSGGTQIKDGLAKQSPTMEPIKAEYMASVSGTADNGTAQMDAAPAHQQQSANSKPKSPLRISPAKLSKEKLCSSNLLASSGKNGETGGSETESASGTLSISDILEERLWDPPTPPW